MRSELVLLDELVIELKEASLDEKSLINAIFGYASGLGIHATEIKMSAVDDLDIAGPI